MKNHTPNLPTLPLPVLELVPVSLQPDPRAHLAALASLALDRCPAELVAQRTGRSPATVYGWRHPATVGGLRALDLLTAPRPFSRPLVRGLGLALDGGGPPPDGPSRSSLAAVLARVGGLLLVVSQEDPSRLSQEALDDRIRTLDEAEDALRRERQKYDVEALRRKLDAQQKVGG